ncbi:plastocyanin/azurin family copper-binding protein, partial [Georgenia sp. 311]|uniref:OmpL47-type beta-barrel domain-containing protein n=1 Tax=Georgenia sp. 311 TaxID=2585134 RepID=UPI00159BBBF5
TPRPRTRSDGSRLLRRLLVALLGALAGLSLVPAAASAQDQVLTWTAGNPVDRYLSAPSTAVAGPATIIFDNSVAAGNTIGMPHTLTFDTSTPGYNHDVSLNIVANPFDAQGGRHEAQVTLTPGKYRYFCTIPGHGMMVGEFTVTGDDPGDPDPDTTAPAVTATVTGDQDADDNYVGSATVTLAATDDGSGVDTVEYSLDGGDWTAYTTPLTVSAPGEHTVAYRATDVAGNTADGSVDFTVVAEDVPDPDTTAPEVSATVTGEQDADEAYVGSATVTLAATDADSGVDTVEYSLDGGDWTAYTTPVVVSEPGEHTLAYRATDVAGNTADGSVTFTVVAEDTPDPDTTAPEVSATVTGEQDEDDAYVGSATVTVSATDADSGVDTVEYSLDGGDWTAYTAPVVVSTPGEHTVAYRATDVAGNTADGTVTFTVVAEDTPDPDTTAPEVTATVTGEQDEDDNYVGSATVTLAATDADSGVAMVEYSLDGGEFTHYHTPVVVSEPGEHTLAYRATDVAGNTADGTVSFTVVAEDTPDPDTTAPEVSATVTGDQDEDDAYVGSATVTVSATDADSGVDTVEYSLDGGDWTAYTTPVVVSEPGEHTVAYRATDVAGNTADGTVSFTVVAEDVPDPDTTAPEVSATVTGEQDEDDAYVGSATVTVSATDADSGVDTVEYSLDGGDWTAYTTPVVVSEPGEHTLAYRASDVAGNTADGTVTFTVVEDVSEPGECSDTRATVVIGGVDTGVENVDTADGCLNDLIDEDGDHATHGAFVRHVGDVLRPLAADGVITQRELGAVLRAAVRSDVGRQ